MYFFKGQASEVISLLLVECTSPGPCPDFRPSFLFFLLLPFYFFILYISRRTSDIFLHRMGIVRNDLAVFLL
jgi:hypothetical protein